MKENINFNKVADIYDYYVNVDFDIPFFLKETENYNEEILELMCGTGRVSIPLLESGKKMTCVDYSKGMLDSFYNKIKNKQYDVTLLHYDVTELKLDKEFGFIILPFHSLTEILLPVLQLRALKNISLHLKKNGIFLLTLQNPNVRLKLADGLTRIIGKFKIDNERQLIISYMNQYDEQTKIVSGYQFYEIFDQSNTLVEKRFLEINFRPVSNSELRNMLKDTELKIADVYGDYSYTEYDEETSNFMIYKLKKN